MPDLLVNLLRLPPADDSAAEAARAGLLVRRAQAWELSPVREFVTEHFSRGWADEISSGFAARPVTVYVAARDGRLAGFAAYECTRRGFFGPTGVAPAERGRGAGRALLLACLWGLRELGYVYGVIGGAGPVEFYGRAVGATVIPDSEPGIYADPLRRES